MFPSATATLRVLQQAHFLQVPISQAAVKNSAHGIVRPGMGHAERSHQLLPPCHIRLTDFVESMAPIFQPCALMDMYTRLYWVGRASDYGMDAIWCRLLARLWKRPLLGTCAVIDL